jgi:Leucine-rich repeat (LRR) protein
MNDGLNIKIKVLNISGNTIKSLPVEVFSLTNLKTMQASRCSLQRIADMTPLDKLQQLDLDQNDLEVDLLGPLPVSLVKLDLATNHFSAVPSSITLLVNLVELNLSFNRIESTFGLGALVQLTDLNLDDNNICELSEDMAALVKLRRISLQNNRIVKNAFSRDGQSIPVEFLVQTAVDTINLTGNKGLRKAEVMNFDGIEAFMERRKKIKDKQFQGGALTDMNLFGIE